MYIYELHVMQPNPYFNSCLLSEYIDGVLSINNQKGLSWSRSYGFTTTYAISVWTPLKRCVLDTTLCDKLCQWLATGRWFSPGTPISTTNKTDRHDHDITEILLKVASNAITLTPNYQKLAKWIISILHPNTLKQKKQHQQLPLSYFLTFTSNYTNCQLFTRFYDKIADFNLAVIHFPHLYSNMSTSQVY